MTRLRLFRITSHRWSWVNIYKSFYKVHSFSDHNLLIMSFRTKNRVEDRHDIIKSVSFGCLNGLPKKSLEADIPASLMGAALRMFTASSSPTSPSKCCFFIRDLRAFKLRLIAPFELAK